MRDYPSLFLGVFFPPPPLLIPPFYDVIIFLSDFLHSPADSKVKLLKYNGNTIFNPLTYPLILIYFESMSKQPVVV